MNNEEINPDEIFIDSSNLPNFDVHQFEGRIERPISRRTIVTLSTFFILCSLFLVTKLWVLQVKHGEAFAIKSENNRLDQTAIFSNRGVIYDRNGVALAANSQSDKDQEFALRTYTELPGFAHILGYLKYPTKDSSGFYYQKEFVGKDGVEKEYNDLLTGENGVKIIETDALGKIQSQSVVRPPRDGENLTLSIDSKIQTKLYEFMSSTAAQVGFSGGAGVIMDVRTGNIIALTSFPEYSPALMSKGDSEAVSSYLNDQRTPFLNRVVGGVYTPGSIIKIIIASGALEENIINPEKEILSTGSISLPNPYFPEKKSVFNDWKAHGWVDMRKALAVSSDVYFYEVGGGFEGQKGLGIEKIEKYARIFGLGSPTGIKLGDEKSGVIPNPAWKKINFGNDPWRVGDTYNTSIGQYGFQITPLQAVRYVASVANGGKLFTPSLLLDDKKNPTPQILPIDPKNLTVVREGMRQGVKEGTAKGLDIPSVNVAGKTGTAELGTLKKYVNSWSVGFFPYENPHYAYAVIMEKGPHENQIGATYVMRQLLDWMTIYASEYFSID